MDINKLFTNHLISMITGFGMFWWFVIWKWNIWADIIFGLLTASYMSLILNETADNCQIKQSAFKCHKCGKNIKGLWNFQGYCSRCVKEWKAD